jgi:hypothetical protein
MTVAELIEKLKEYPQDLRVVVRGYEMGVNDVSHFEELEILLDYYDAWYYGKHEGVFSWTKDTTHEKVPALKLCGE